MNHIHGSEYQIRIVFDDDSQELSSWMASEEELLKVIASLPQTRGKAFWLRERDKTCPYCGQEPRVIIECPIVCVPCQRYRPHDSRYLVAMGSKNPGEVFGAAFGGRL